MRWTGPRERATNSSPLSTLTRWSSVLVNNNDGAVIDDSDSCTPSRARNRLSAGATGVAS